MKIAKYLSPQIYKSIFSGQRDVAIVTERKKLTIFFSDIKDFTATSERLQPEDLTALLNEYLTAMSAIAMEYGATVDKFIGDAVLAFFGDPETRGVSEDARQCLLMAVAMQRRITQLNVEWRNRGVEDPFRVRMGINTGFCNVGNFGSDDRMDYTIIGAEANLAARLQSSAEPGGIVISYETYALVRDIVRATPQEPITMKGIRRQIVPYVVEGPGEGDAAAGERDQRAWHRHRFLPRPRTARQEHARAHPPAVAGGADGARYAAAARDAVTTLNRASGRGGIARIQTDFAALRRASSSHRGAPLVGADGDSLPEMACEAHAQAPNPSHQPNASEAPRERDGSS